MLTFAKYFNLQTLLTYIGAEYKLQKTGGFRDRILGIE